MLIHILCSIGFDSNRESATFTGFCRQAKKVIIDLNKLRQKGHPIPLSSSLHHNKTGPYHPSIIILLLLLLLG
jgi:hypothetical protein